MKPKQVSVGDTYDRSHPQLFVLPVADGADDPHDLLPAGARPGDCGHLDFRRYSVNRCGDFGLVIDTEAGSRSDFIISDLGDLRKSWHVQKLVNER